MAESPTAAQAASSGTPAPIQTLVVAIASVVAAVMVVILGQALGLDSEVLAPISTAAVAVVPSFMIWRAERRRSKQSKITELASGRFHRSPVYVSIIATGLLGLAYLLALLLGAWVAAVPIGFEVATGLITEDQAAGLMQSVSVAVISFMLVAVFVTALPIGAYVAHRVTKLPLLWALLAAAVSVVLQSAITAAGGGAEFPNWWAWDMAVFFIPQALGVGIGVWRGTRSRALYWAKRLFRELPEQDRRAVLSMMSETAGSVLGPDSLL